MRPLPAKAQRTLLKRAHEVGATSFEVKAAAILLAVNGLDAALKYLDGCRRHFETAAQVRAFLRGRGWSRRSQRGTRVRCDITMRDSLMLWVKMPSRNVHYRDARQRILALEAMFAGRNVRVCPLDSGTD